MKKVFCLNNIQISINYPSALNDFVRFFSTEKFVSKPNQLGIFSDIYFAKKPDAIVEEKISNSLSKTSSGVLYRMSPFLQVLIELVEQNKIISKIYVNSAPKPLDSIKDIILGLKTERKRFLYVQALRHAVLFPYFALMNQWGCTLLHGGAYVQGGVATVILGFDGVGKSSILEATRQTGSSLISDNFLLFDSTHVYFVPEPLRVFDGITNGHLHGKRFVPLHPTYEKVPAKKVVFVTIGKQYRLQRYEGVQIQRLAGHFFNSLPEFIDFAKYTTALHISNSKFNYKRKFGIDPTIPFYFCQRASLRDNLRLINDIKSI